MDRAGKGDNLLNAVFLKRVGSRPALRPLMDLVRGSGMTEVSRLYTQILVSCPLFTSHFQYAGESSTGPIDWLVASAKDAKAASQSPPRRSRAGLGVVSALRIFRFAPYSSPFDFFELTTSLCTMQ